MRFDSRNLLIGFMFLFIIALMVLMYKVNKVAVQRMPEHVPPKVFVAGLTEAVLRQNQAFSELSHQNRWLRIHLENCLTLIESERGLEPISVLSETSEEPFLGVIYNLDKEGPFVRPFVTHVPDPEYFEREEEDIRFLTCMVNISNNNAHGLSLNGMDEIIPYFQRRLERIAPDPNTP
jgi:hypothetical protein